MTDEETSALESPQMDEMLHEEQHPRGTLFLMLVFLMAIVGMWSYIYLLMLEQGGPG